MNAPAPVSAGSAPEYTDPAMLMARAEFYPRAWPTRAYLDYVSRNEVDVGLISGFVGATGVLPIADVGNGRFDWAVNREDAVDAFICEVIAEDGETPIDLVAWPLDRPSQVMTLFGRAALLGLWAAANPATFHMGKPLVIRRSPLDWLRSGCRGAVILNRKSAARFFLDLPGRIAAEDHEHAQELCIMMSSLIPPDLVVVPRAR